MLLPLLQQHLPLLQHETPPLDRLPARDLHEEGFGQIHRLLSLYDPRFTA